MTQQYQTVNRYVVTFLVMFWSLKLRITTCLKALKPLLSKGCGRGEIGKHKGLKTSAFSGQITRVTTNFFKYNNYLIDIMSVEPLVRGRSDVTKS